LIPDCPFLKDECPYKAELARTSPKAYLIAALKYLSGIISTGDGQASMAKVMACFVLVNLVGMVWLNMGAANLTFMSGIFTLIMGYIYKGKVTWYEHGQQAEEARPPP